MKPERLVAFWRIGIRFYCRAKRLGRLLIAEINLRRGTLQRLADDLRRIEWNGRVAPEDCSSEAPTDPDMRDYRIRLFSPRLRYVTGEGRMRGCGKG